MLNRLKLIWNVLFVFILLICLGLVGIIIAVPAAIIWIITGKNLFVIIDKIINYINKISKKYE